MIKLNKTAIQHRSGNKKLNCAVIVSGYAVLVKVGVGEEERSAPQKLLVDIKLHYPELPLGCESDDITDVICYDQLCSKVHALLFGKEFKLIEHIAFYIYNNLKSCYLDYSFNIKVTKFPSIKNLEGYTAFEITE